MCPTDCAIAPAGSLPYHYGSPQRHWIYTGPLVIVSAALDAFHSDGIGVNTADALQQRKARSLPQSTGYAKVHTRRF